MKIKLKKNYEIKIGKKIMKGTMKIEDKNAQN